MPIKDISKEEQSHLYLTGVFKREHLQLTENERGMRVKVGSTSICLIETYFPANFNTKLPLQYYNNLAESLNEKDVGTCVDTR